MLFTILINETDAETEKLELDPGLKRQINIKCYQSMTENRERGNLLQLKLHVIKLTIKLPQPANCTDKFDCRTFF